MASDTKRGYPHEANGGGQLAVKKQRRQDGSALPVSTRKVEPEGPARTSALLAPTMLLTGHAGEVFTAKFSPDGTVVASGSHDKHVFLWRTYGECENYMMLQGHKGAVLELHWTTDGERIASASPDKSVRVWDAATGAQVKKMAEHDNFVNSCCPLKRGPPLLVSGSDDATAKLWDLRAKRSVATFDERFQVVAVAFASAGDQVYVAGVENVIKVWDLRKAEVAMTMKGHAHTVTGLRVSPDGTHLLSNAMDNTLRMWDMRPFAPANRCTKVFTGHQHNFEQNLLKCDWSPDGSRVTAGSADRMVYIWDAASRALLYQLPGHSGSVNETTFHPTEPIICSAGSDKQIYLGELVL
ncbi:hypothetical protein WJX81_004972 [Elliptochloris bilobata]|uniref:Uncharacterized protein n=1 Tax=Elliptochloris bilobata TaxID=381761 RepID=A0AAW1RB28_9CHLO